MKKNRVLAALAAAIVLATFGAAGASEFPTLPSVKGSRLVHMALVEPDPVRFGDVILPDTAPIPTPRPERAVDTMLTNSVSVPSAAKFVREPHGTPGFLGGLPLMKVAFAPPKYFVFPPLQAACFGFGEDIACVGRSVITVLRTVDPHTCFGFGDPEGTVCDPRIITY